MNLRVILAATHSMWINGGVVSTVEVVSIVVTFQTQGFGQMRCLLAVRWGIPYNPAL